MDRKLFVFSTEIDMKLSSICIVSTLLFVLYGCESKPGECTGKSELSPLVFNKNWYINESLGKENLGVHFGNKTTTIFHPMGFRQGSTCRSGEYIFFYPYENFSHTHDDEIIEVIHVDEKLLKLAFNDGLVFTYYSD